MASFPASIARVPNLLLSQFQLSNIQRTNVDLFGVQTSLSTGRAINKPSDDVVRAATISILDERLERSEQQLSNLDSAERQLNLLDQALGEASDLILQAKNLASEQSNFGVSAEERASQAIVVDSLIRQLFNIVNRDSVNGFIFGGGAPGDFPLEEFGDGILFSGDPGQLLTDLGIADTVPVTLGRDDSVGGLVERFRGLVEIVPPVTGDTRLEDLNGARRLGVDRGEILLAINNGPSVRVDLTDADTVGDVADLIERAIRDQEADMGVTVLGPGGVSFDNDGFTIDASPGMAIDIQDIVGAFTAQDLGLASIPAFSFTTGVTTGMSLEPKLTLRSQLGALGGPLGQIQVTNAGRTAVVDLSDAQTVQDVRNALLATELGVDLEVDPISRELILINEFAGSSEQSLSVEEVPGGLQTAARLGIRTLDLSTPIERFNYGEGFEVIGEQPDPITGLPNAQFSRDFTFTLGDGFSFSIDLRDDDLVSVQTLLNAINTQANDALAAAGRASTDFVASLDPDGPNGLVFQQNPTIGGTLTATRENNSPAFEGLGLDEAIFDTATGALRTADTAKVRVDNVFTFLLDMKQGLLANDTSGIALAAVGLERQIDRVAQERALVGGLARQTQDATRLQEDRIVLDEQTRSELRDTDFAAAATRFSLLQTQLQAGLQVAAQQSSRSLLDFIG